MATIGQALTTPESGWKRYDDSDSKIVYEGGKWSVSTSNASHYNKTLTSFTTSTLDNSQVIKFKFKGTKLRLISYTSSTYSEKILVNIDNNPHIVNMNRSASGGTSVNQCLVFEKTGLENKSHVVEIKVESTQQTFYNIGLDAIDIDDNGELEIYYLKRIAVQNSNTKKIYSLDNKTLIHLPSTSDKNMILHGIESGKEIKLDEQFNKMKYVNDTSEVFGIGKKFTHTLGMSKTKVNKIIL